ncbi:MAG: hypothetical protein IPP49_15320 [Saprospiraceae bacterium]|nr:hypothetical protein [Saprospiraceae bacterium]
MSYLGLNIFVAMSKKAIWSIIIIMTLSLIGVGVIQYFWIKRAVNLDEKILMTKSLLLSIMSKRD